MLSPVVMVSLMQTFWTVALVLVDLVVVSGFPHLLLLRLQNLYVPNEHLCIALRLLPSLPLPIGLLLLLLLFL